MQAADMAAPRRARSAQCGPLGAAPNGVAAIAAVALAALALSLPAMPAVPAAPQDAAAAAPDPDPAAVGPPPAQAFGGALHGALHGAADPTLHKSTLRLTGYPPVGGTAELVFSVTYSAAASPAPAPVRLDVTGSEYSDMYRVYDIVSNVGTGDPSVFGPYDHATEAAVAEDGRTYTVRASFEVLAPGVIPVYARGLDGDIVTVHVAASDSVSMPYEAYLLAGQTYLDDADDDNGGPLGGGPWTSSPPRDPRHAWQDPRQQQQQQPPPLHPGAVPRPAPKAGLLPGGPGIAAPASSHPAHFDAYGTVRAEGYLDGDPLVPIHGIMVCAYDYNAALGSETILYTASGENACAFTGHDGAYRISGVVNRDPDDLSAADAFLVLYSRGADDLDVTMADYYYYYDESPQYARDVTVDVEYDFVLFSELAGAARIVDTMSDARAFFEPHGLPSGPLLVLWQHDAGASALPGSGSNGAKYGGSPDTDHTIWLDGESHATADDSLSRYVMLHEFGHYAASAGGVLNDYYCPVHYGHLKSSLGCAWGEGWANFVPHMVDDRPTMPFTATIASNMEAGVDESLLGVKRYHFESREPPSRNIGEKVEGRVAAALWDMADSVSDPVHDTGGPGRPLAADNLAVGYGRIVDAVLSATYNHTGDFYDAWERAYYGGESAEAVMRLHNMSFAIPNEAKYYEFAGSFGSNGTGDGQMHYPLGVDVAPDGSVLVADTANSRVQVFDADGVYVQQFGSSGTGDGHLLLPAGVSSNGTHAFVADALNSRVEIFATPEWLHAGRVDGYGDGRRFGMPTGVTANSTHLLVSDSASYSIAILRHGGQPVAAFSSSQDPTTVDFLLGDSARILDARLEWYGLNGSGLSLSYRTAIASDGTIMIADFAYPNIWTLAPNGTFDAITPWSARVGDRTSDIYVDSLGRTVSSEWTRGLVRIVGGDGVPVEEFGGLGRGDGEFHDLAGVAVGPSGRIYAADAYNNRVQMFDHDREPPRVDRVWAHPPNRTTANTPDVLHIAVSFTEPVTVDASGGAPALDLETGAAGGASAAAAYLSGSGSRTLTFRYAVDPGDSTPRLGYTPGGALRLNGAAIMDGSGNSADVSLPAPGAPGSLSANSDIRIAWDPPSVVGVRSLSADGAYGAGASIEIAVDFSAPVVVTGSPELRLDAGGGAAGAPAASAVYASGNGTARLVFTYAVAAGHSSDDLAYAGTDALSAAAAAAAGAAIEAVSGHAADLGLPAPGAPGSLSANSDIRIAWDPPSVVGVRSLSADGAYGAGASIEIAVDFSAPVVVTGSPELRLDAGGGAAGAPAASAVYASGNGTARLVFTYAVAAGHSSDDLAYAGTDALSAAAAAAGAAIEAVTGHAADLGLPAPGAPGSLSATSDVGVVTSPEIAVLDIGVLDEDGGRPGGAGSVEAAARLAAADFNAASAGLFLNVTAYDAGGTALSAADALRAAHAGGAGPSVFVGPSTDRGLHAAMPYAAGSGIVLVSAGSTAPSLAVEGDRTFRLLPSDALQADALARIAFRAGAESVHAVLENSSYGPLPLPGGPEAPPPQGRFSHGFAAALADSAVPYLSGTVILGGAGAGGQDDAAAAAAAAALDAAVRLPGSPPPSATAVVYLGSPAGLAALAGHAAGYAGLRSAMWLASDMSAGSDMLAGGGPAAAFAAQTGLTAVRWSPPGNDLAREVDSRLPSPQPQPQPQPAGEPRDPHRARAAYDAVLLLGAAAAAAGGTGAAGIADRMHAAAASHDGALGDIVLDPAGDLWVPARYGVWKVAPAAGQGGAAGAAPGWARQPDANEARSCSLSLGSGSLDFGSVNPGSYTRPAGQTVINSGQLPFAEVELAASPWYVGSGGACAEGSLPSLPVGLSELRTGRGGAFAPLTAGGTMVAGGLQAGGEEPLWYRINLTGYSELPRATFAQCVTYVVQC